MFLRVYIKGSKLWIFYTIKRRKSKKYYIVLLRRQKAIIYTFAILILHMLEKLKTYTKKPVFKSLSDVRSLGMMAFGIISLLVTWSSIRVVQSNYDLQKQISKLQQQNDVQQLANTNQGLKNEYFKTDAYLELAARKHFNKALPGERLVIVPKDVALAHSIEEQKVITSDQAIKDTVKASGSSFQRNFNAWLDFLFHKQSE